MTLLEGNFSLANFNANWKCPSSDGVLIEASGAASQHQSAQLGVYQLTGERVRNFPVYKHKCLDVYLFVGPNGSWRVGPDTSTFKGTHFKNPEKPTPDTPPRSGWQYWNEEWVDDDTIRVGFSGANFNADWKCSSSGMKNGWMITLLEWNFP